MGTARAPRRGIAGVSGGAQGPQPGILPDFSALLAPVREAARELPRAALPALCGALAAVQAEILMPAEPSASAAADRLLTPEEVGQRMNRSRDWTYRHRHELPLTRLSSGRWGVSEARLKRWMAARSS